MARRRTRIPLSVYLNGRLVGQLRRQSGGSIDFQYDRSWLEWDSAIPVSLAMPLREDRYIGDPVITLERIGIEAVTRRYISALAM
jgi:serine/threonine-protein kinase HipA